MEACLINKRLVVSAVNFSEGGPLTVLRDCLASAAISLPPEWEIIALVHDEKLIDEPRIKIISVPDAKKSWLRRLYHEWFSFGRFSRDIKPDLWLSLHDITPRVLARRQVVYCHNPSPFYRLPWCEAWLEPKLWIFNRFYRYLYGAFIERNYWVIVQQVWLRDAFQRMYGILPIVVAHPSVNISVRDEFINSSDGKAIFFYPALPRVFKNFELICEAVLILKKREVNLFEVRMTLSGNENRYSKWLYDKYHSIPELIFIGLQNREQMSRQYREAIAVLFPSKLETWGLPISEAKLHNKLLLVVDIPYAHETVGTYDRVSFFSPTNAIELADLMQSIIEKRFLPTGSKGEEPSQPFAHNWNELWLLITEGL